MYYIDNKMTPYFNPSKKVIDSNDLNKCTKEEFELVIKSMSSEKEKFQGEIEKLESLITRRIIRNAILGDNYALKKIKEIEGKIESIRVNF